MDVHRLRTVPYPTAAINALAFTHSSGASANGQPLRLAVGRANGDIEIWNPLKGAWHHETTFRGGQGRSVEGLAWIQEPNEIDPSGFTTYGRSRLFSIGYSSTVTEWDLLTGLPLRQSTGNHSEVWCLVSQPKPTKRRGLQNGEVRDVDEDHGEQNLVIGCADGTLVLLATKDEDLTFSKFIVRAPKKRARALSLAFQNRDIIVAGFADSTIRIYDIRNGNSIRNMSLGSGPRGGPRDILCWAITCLPNGTIISADSTGQVCFWDGKNYGQLQRIQGHRADALCLATSDDGETVMSGGVDRRTVVYSLGKGEGHKRRWAKFAHRRLHQHDIKAMASFENSKMSLVASGGLDTCLLLTPLRDFTTEYHRKLSHIPQSSPLTGSSEKRLIVSWWGNEITIWKIYQRTAEDLSINLLPSTNEDPKYRTVARLHLKGDNSISAACLSNDGEVLAVATSAEVRVFQLASSTSRNRLKIRKLEVPESFKIYGARLIQISDDLKWIVQVDQRNTITVARLASKDGKIYFLPTTTHLDRRPLSKNNQNSLNGSWGRYDRTITQVTIASGGNLIAVADIGGDIDTWVLEGHEDLSTSEICVLPQASSPISSTNSDTSDSVSEEDDEGQILFYGRHWAQAPSNHLLPRLSCCPIIFSFRPVSYSKSTPAPKDGRAIKPPTRKNPHPYSHDIPTGIEDRLFVLTAAHEIFEFEVLKGRFSDWSRRNPTSQAPEEFRLQRDRAIGYVWDISQNRQRIWIHGAAWVCMFDLKYDFGSLDASPEELNQNQIGQKRNRPMVDIGDQIMAKKHTSGAGSKIPDHELRGAITRVRLLDGEGCEIKEKRTNFLNGRNHGLNSDAGGNEDEDNSSEDDDLSAGAIVKHRRSEIQTTSDTLKNLENPSTDNEITATTTNKSLNLALTKFGQSDEQPPAFYITYRYRAILGMLPLLTDTQKDDYDNPGTLENASVNTLEVAIVERPDWELDLPPRYHGKQEWQKAAASVS